MTLTTQSAVDEAARKARRSCLRHSPAPLITRPAAAMVLV